MAESDIASLLNRPDLSVVTGPLVDPYNSNSAYGSGLPGFAQSTGLGQASLGIVALIVLAFVGFYVWTRPHQK